MMPTSVAGILKLAPMSLSSATGINSVVLKINAAKAKVITETHCRVGLGGISADKDDIVRRFEK